MTNVDLLKEKMAETGMTVTAICRKSGILRETLYNRFNGVGEFSASEITKLCSVLGLSKEDREAIFFATEVELNSI